MKSKVDYGNAIQQSEIIVEELIAHADAATAANYVPPGRIGCVDQDAEPWELLAKPTTQNALIGLFPRHHRTTSGWTGAALMRWFICCSVLTALVVSQTSVACAALLVSTGTHSLQVNGIAQGNPFHGVDNHTISVSSSLQPPHEIEGYVDHPSPDPYPFTSWDGIDGYARGIASYGDGNAPYNWMGLEQAPQVQFVYAAAAAYRNASIQAAASQQMRIMPGVGENLGDPISLFFMLAEGVWQRTVENNSVPPYVNGRVDVFGSDVHPTEFFFGGNGLRTFVATRTLNARIGDYVRLSVWATAGGHGYGTSGSNDEVAAFMFAAVPGSGIEFLHQFSSSNTDVLMPPNTPRVAVPEPSSSALLALGILGTGLWRRFQRRLGTLRVSRSMCA